MIEKLTMKKTMILEKPSGTISISDPMTAIQRKFYNAFLYVAKETLKKDPNKAEFEIPLNELKKFFKIEDKKNTYLKERIEELVKLTAQYNILGKDKEEWGIFSLLPFVRIYLDKKTQIGIVKFEIPTVVKKAILNKEKNFFAKIDLVIIRGLKSKYAVILYELLKDYESVEIPEMSMEDFRKIFGIENKYKMFKDLKKRVIESAIKEINNNPNINWEINYKLRKSGPKYVGIKFLKKPKPIMKQLEQQKEKKVESAKVQVLISLIPEKYRSKVLERYIAEIKDKYDVDYIEAQILYANSKNPENYLAYLKTAIKEDYANYEEHKKQDEQAKKEFQEFFANAQKVYKEKVLPKRDDIEFKDYLRDFIYHHFTKGKITEKQKDLYLEFWEKLYGNNA